MRISPIFSAMLKNGACPESTYNSPISPSNGLRRLIEQLSPAPYSVRLASAIVLRTGGQRPPTFYRQFPYRPQAKLSRPVLSAKFMEMQS